MQNQFAQEAAQGAHAQWRSIADALRERAPKLAEVKDEAREDVLALFRTWRRHQPYDSPHKYTTSLHEA